MGETVKAKERTVTMPEAQHLPGDLIEICHPKTGEFMLFGEVMADGLTIDASVRAHEATEAKKAAIAARLAKRNAAIPTRLFELIEANVKSNMVHALTDTLANVASKDDLVALWNAIVDADKSL